MQHAIREEKPKTLKKSKNMLNIRTYNTRTINDLNTDAFNIMLNEVENIKWDVKGLAEKKEKESKIEPLENLQAIFIRK